MVSRIGRIKRLIASTIMLGGGFAAAAAAEDRNRAGGLVFSDELGGFEILDVSGSGTPDDPIVIVQRLAHTEPVVLIVRVDGPRLDRPFTASSPSFFRSALTAVVINDSRYPWIGFDFELQQERNQPSVYGDGLSFDQMQTFASRDIRSNRFTRTMTAAEPYDRLRFRDGSVDPGGDVMFDVNLLDVSPVPEFYILLHPQVPLS